MTTKAQKRAMHNYYMKNRNRKKLVLLRFDRTDDKEVVEEFDKQPNKTAYVRRLVLESIGKREED